MTHTAIVVPFQYDPDMPGDLFGAIVRDLFSTNDRGKRSYEMLRCYYAFDGQKKLTLLEIGILNNHLSRERVRQILGAAKKVLKSLLTKGEHNPTSMVLHPTLVERFRLYPEYLRSQPFYSEAEIIHKTKEYFHLLEINFPVFCLILELYDYKLVGTGSTDTRAWISSDIDSNRLQTVLKVTFDYLRKTCIAKTADEIVLGINSNYPRKQRLGHGEIVNALNLHNDIEQLENGTYQLKFESLRSFVDKSYRILYEHGGFMHLRELTRLLSEIEAKNGRKGVSQHSIGTHMSADPRFQNIGRSGEWFLIEFAKPSEKSTENIIPLMQKALHAANKALTAEEIYDYVRERRPVVKATVNIYLNNDRNFVKVNGGYALAVWNPEPEERPTRSLDIIKIAENVELVFKNRGVGEMPLTELAREVAALYEGVNVKTIYSSWLRLSPAIQVVDRPGKKRKRRIAVFKPDYHAHLNDKSLPVMQAIEKAIHEILSKQSGKRMLMSHLRDQVVKQLHCPKASVYQVLRRMPDVEKVSENKEKYCQLRDTGQLYDS